MDGFEEHFASVDTSFVAYLLCSSIGNLVRIVPVQDSKVHSIINYQFHIAPCKGHTLDSIRKAQMEYTNRKTQVEPISFHSVRRQLLEQIHTFRRNVEQQGA